MANVDRIFGQSNGDLIDPPGHLDRGAL